MSDRKSDPLIFFAFDLLFTAGEDLRALPLAVRKARLEKFLKGVDTHLRYVEHFVSSGDAVLQSACRMSLEGIVSKRRTSPYRFGRVRTWIKTAGGDAPEWADVARLKLPYRSRDIPAGTLC